MACRTNAPSSAYLHARRASPALPAARSRYAACVAPMLRVAFTHTLPPHAALRDAQAAKKATGRADITHALAPRHQNEISTRAPPCLPAYLLSACTLPKHRRNAGETSGTR